MKTALFLVIVFGPGDESSKKVKDFDDIDLCNKHKQSIERVNSSKRNARLFEYSYECREVEDA